MAELAAALSAGVAAELKAAVDAAPSGRVAPPSRRDRLSADLEDEFDKALSGMSLDELMTAGIPQGTETLLEPETKVQGRVVAVRRDDVFLELAGREQGIVPLQQFPQPPEIGAVVEVVVQRFNPEEGLYDLRFPEVAADVGDWGDVHEGMLVDVTVTAHNTGGLECEVNHIRGFIPVSQIALYRVEDLAQFVGQRFACIIVEANPERRNLVLSRRAVLEREKEEARENLFASLQVGQVHQGTVRKIMDFGAFVDIGGVDGLLHVSQLSWGRVGHPKDVLSEGQPIQIRIERIDKETGKLSFSYRELLENPWATAAQKFLPNSIVKGKVVKLMDFGAFVELEPGVEGLIHISELAPKRVFRVSDVVKEGEEVEVLVLSVNTESQRMSLSIKALAKPAEPTEKEKREAEAGELPAAKAKRKQQAPTGPLTGGLGRPAGGDRFGLKW
jgi:small subunit ribosomal protein S1